MQAAAPGLPDLTGSSRHGHCSVAEPYSDPYSRPAPPSDIKLRTAAVMAVSKIIRGVGAGILLLLVLPIHRIAPGGSAGSPTEHLRALTGSYFQVLWIAAGTVAVLAVALGFTRLPRRLEPLLAKAKQLLLSPGEWSFALLAGLVSGVLALLLSIHGFALQPALMDATSQLIHARYLAAGELAGPHLAHAEFVTFQHMVNLPGGWSSQYPPGHLLMLAIGFALGVPWIVGPVMTMVAVTFVTRLAEDILDPLPARLGGLFLAVSPFFLGHSATYMSHATAAAFGAGAVFAAIRSIRAAPDERKHFAWAAAAGAFTGLVFATRPLSGVVIGAVVAAIPWILADAPRSLRAGVNRAACRLPAFAAGVIPFLVAVGLYNHLLFGDPTTFGYVAAQGPGHGMGFHQDPWGTLYTPAHAIAQLSTDLITLGVDLLLTPISAVLVVAVWLVAFAPTFAGARLFLLWGLLPPGLHFFYWHQDLFLGPRLLNEFALPWAMLTALAVIAWVRRSRTMSPPRFLNSFDPGSAVLGAVVISVIVASTLMIPGRVASYRAQWGAESRTPMPDAPENALVFVHGDWSERLGSRLAGRGMRVDSIRTALRHNSSCEIQDFLDAQERSTEEDGGARQSSDLLRFSPRPGVELMDLRLPTGTFVRTYVDEDPGAACVRELQADRHGVLPLTNLLWRGDLPGLAHGAPFFARDLGPDRNRLLMEKHDGRDPFFYLRPGPGEEPILLSYQEGMNLLW